MHEKQTPTQATQHANENARQLVIEHRAKRLVALKLDGIPRPMINTMVAAVLDDLDTDDTEAVFFRAEEIIEKLPHKHNRVRFQ